MKKKKKKKRKDERNEEETCLKLLDIPWCTRVQERETCQTYPLAVSRQAQWLPQPESSFGEGLKDYEAHH